MQAEQDHDRKVTLHLSEACRNPALAAPLLAQKLGISQAEAADRLCSLAGPISAPLSHRHAMGLRAILSTLGVRVDLHPSGHDTPQSFDLSLQMQSWADPEKVAAGLEQVIGGSRTEHLRALAQPAGLVLPEIPAAAAAELDRRLRRIRGLVLLHLDRRHACLDLFAPSPLSAEQARLLSQVSRTFGLTGDATSGAILVGLGQGLAARVLARFAGAGLIAVDRAFQRFDLHLTGYAGWLTKDLADFLAARTGTSRARFEFLSAAEPIRLDTGLTYLQARRFCADYAAIGLFVRLKLCGLPQNADNPIL